VLSTGGSDHWFGSSLTALLFSRRCNLGNVVRIVFTPE
jgi:hypothetical protein